MASSFLSAVFIFLFAFPVIHAAYANFDDTKLLCLVNAERAKAGVSSLTFSDKLNRAAQDHSNDQQRRNTMTHDPSLVGRINAVGYQYSSVGENVAEGQQNEDDVMNTWMNSPEHRDNILNSAYTQFGGGRAGAYWTQDFAAGESGGQMPDCSAYGGAAASRGRHSTGGSLQHIHMPNIMNDVSIDGNQANSMLSTLSGDLGTGVDTGSDNQQQQQSQRKKHSRRGRKSRNSYGSSNAYSAQDGILGGNQIQTLLGSDADSQPQQSGQHVRQRRTRGNKRGGAGRGGA